MHTVWGSSFRNGPTLTESPVVLSVNHLSLAHITPVILPSSAHLSSSLLTSRLVLVWAFFELRLHHMVNIHMHTMLDVFTLNAHEKTAQSL